MTKIKKPTAALLILFFLLILILPAPAPVGPGPGGVFIPGGGGGTSASSVTNIVNALTANGLTNLDTRPISLQSNLTVAAVFAATNTARTNLIAGKLNIGSEPTDNSRSLTVSDGIHAYTDAFGTSFSGDGAIHTDTSLHFGSVLQMANAWAMSGSLGNFLIRDATDNPMTNWMFGDYATNLMFGIHWNSNPPALYLRTLSNTIPADFKISGTFYGNGSGLTNLDASALASGVVPMGRVSASTATAGYVLSTDGSVRNWTNRVSLTTVDGATTVNGAFTNTTYSSTGTNYSTKLRVGGAAEASVAVNVTGDVQASGVYRNGGSMTINGAVVDLLLTSGQVSFWDGSGNADVGIKRNASGILEVNSGTASAIRDLRVRGVILPQQTVIPTNSIPSSSSGVTNWVLLNLTNTIGTGGMMWIATNTAAAGSFLTMKPTVTLGTYP